MGLGRLSIWVRDTARPCLPYQSTAHTWVSVILTCDLQPLNFGAVKNGRYELTDPGAAGGGVHGQPEVPPGSYVVLAVATCKNVYTDMAMVQVGCGQEVCVNLIPKALSTCTAQLLNTLHIAAELAAKYSSSSPAGREIPKEVLSKTISALEELRRCIPEDTLVSALPITLDDLRRMAREEGKRG